MIKYTSVAKKDGKPLGTSCEYHLHHLLNFDLDDPSFHHGCATVINYQGDGAVRVS